MPEIKNAFAKEPSLPLSINPGFVTVSRGTAVNSSSRSSLSV
jgi:hypothetical protein